MRSSTLTESNNFKLKDNDILIVCLYFEIFKWFLFIFKIELIFSGIFCGYQG